MTQDKEQALDEVEGLIRSAYEAGAKDVHANWQEDADPDFKEAASDWLESVRGELTVAISALSSLPEGEAVAWLMKWPDGGTSCVTLNKDDARAAGEAGLIAIPLFTSPQPAVPSGALEAIKALQAARKDFVRKREAMNLARPSMGATAAERALYDERYRADNEAEKALHSLSAKFATMAAEIDLAAMLSSSPTPPQTGEGWQPIESAPKDGTPVDLWYPHPETASKPGSRQPNAWWSGRAWWADNWDYDGAAGEVGFCGEPTHWMPLPTPPKGGDL